jgi:hypothetical protein
LDLLLDEEVYRQQLRQLTAFITGPEFDQLVKSPREFQQFERLAAVLFERQTNHVDRYAALKAESKAYDQLVKRLFPDDYASLRIDDHHIFEARTYDKFKKTWQLLGWKSADDMPAIALMYELHIRAPKQLLPDINVWVFDEENVKSLTALLLKNINLDKITTTDALLDAYEDFYRRTKIWNYVRPTLKAVRLEIRRQETLAKGFGKSL